MININDQGSLPEHSNGVSFEAPAIFVGTKVRNENITWCLSVATVHHCALKSKGGEEK
jgi:hypothetical protein